MSCRQSIVRYATFASILLLLVSSTSSGAERSVWQIGKPDDSFSEFAIPGKYQEFAKTFTQPMVFTVGQSTAARDWPCVHPGPADKWAGRKGPHVFSVDFSLPNAPRGNYRLRIIFSDIHDLEPPLYAVSVGGKRVEYQLPPGTGEALSGSWWGILSQTYDVHIPTSLLKQGENRIELTTTSGSWVLYDALTLSQDPAVPSAAALTMEYVRRIPLAPVAHQMEWKGVAISERGYWCWSTWPVQGEDGKFHLFGERWPENMISQVNNSELRHYVADKPEGPYAFVDIPLARGKKGEWDYSQIYPCVQRNGKSWAMIYTGMSGVGFESMRAGVAVADSINGPWRKTGLAIDLPKDPKHWTRPTATEIGIHVATFIPFHGKWYAYFKSGTRFDHDFMGVAVADRAEGPYTIMDEPCITKNGKHPGTYFEDMFPFVWKDKIYLLVTDNFGRASGLYGGIVMFESNDGLHFPYDKARLAVDLIPAYYKEFDWKRTSNCNGPTFNPKFEAPRFLLIDGVPAYFFGGTGTNVNGGGYPSSYILKILEWAP